jgi:hypothetical protein
MHHWQGQWNTADTPAEFGTFQTSVL